MYMFLLPTLHKLRQERRRWAMGQLARLIEGFEHHARHCLDRPKLLNHINNRIDQIYCCVMWHSGHSGCDQNTPIGCGKDLPTGKVPFCRTEHLNCWSVQALFMKLNLSSSGHSIVQIILGHLTSRFSQRQYTE